MAKGLLKLEDLDRREIECYAWTSRSHYMYIKYLRCNVWINYNLDIH